MGTLTIVNGQLNCKGINKLRSLKPWKNVGQVPFLQVMGQAKHNIIIIKHDYYFPSNDQFINSSFTSVLNKMPLQLKPAFGQGFKVADHSEVTAKVYPRPGSKGK